VRCLYREMGPKSRLVGTRCGIGRGFQEPHSEGEISGAFVISSPTSATAGGADIDRRYRVSIIVAEVGPHVVYHRDHLIVVHHVAQRRHRSLPVDDNIEHIFASFESCLIARERRIRSGTSRSLAIGHVATLADIRVQFFTALFGE
jgi:hypothetical protein